MSTVTTHTGPVPETGESLARRNLKSWIAAAVFAALALGLGQGVHTTWDVLARLEHDRNFVVVTTEYPHKELRPHKVGHAALFFGIALSLVLFTDLRLSAAVNRPCGQGPSGSR
jgi:hypothetical protein